MSAFNIVRFRVKPGMEQKFIEAHKNSERKLSGFIEGHLVKTGEREFSFIGEWNDMNSLVSNRPNMIANLDRFRDLLEDLGGGLGVTDPVSGESVADFYPSQQKSAAQTEQQARH